ncbi:MAG TPA: L,D-transpeptidase [Microvirga sp.]|jgi:lipoprotein-anchoring transpeptidase ErfK/SrfK|nr:L,D-transpeptidase [Microvirga sp.]
MDVRRILVFGLVALALPAVAAPRQAAETRPQPLDLDTINGAAFAAAPGKKASDASSVLIKAQVLLDRARFSPGVIDGHEGDNFHRALAAFERARNLNPDGRLDEEVLAKLEELSTEPVATEYTITPEDVKGPFVERIPEKFEAQADLKRLGYTGPREALAERFHMDEDLLQALNPGKDFDKAGTRIVVAHVGGEPKSPETTGSAQKVAVIEVDKKERHLRALAEDGTLIAVYPASIGSEEKPAPEGEHTVRAIARNPSYTYNPDYAFKGVRAKKPFEIKAGPNNPVGSVWIDLSIESFGIHGTPEPAKVGKSYSHGCVRLTNWDVEELAGMVQKGTRVVFKG